MIHIHGAISREKMSRPTLRVRSRRPVSLKKSFGIQPYPNGRARVSSRRPCGSIAARHSHHSRTRRSVANLSLPRAKGLSIEVSHVRASSPWLATTHGAPTRSRRRYASPPRSRDPVGIPDDGVRARGVRGARRGARARPTRLDPSGGCAEWPRARDRLRGVLARVRAPGREAVRQGARRLGAGGGGEQGHQVDRRDGHGPRARDVRLERRVGCEVRSVAFFGPRAREPSPEAAPRARRERDATRATPRKSRSTPTSATPRLGSRPRAFPRVVSRAFSARRQRDNPNAVRRPHVTRGRNRVAAPPRADRARRAARFLRPAHVTTRGGSARGPFRSATTRSSCPSVPRIDRRSPWLSLPRTSRSARLFHVDFSRFSSPRAARRWTAPAACAV